MRIFSLAPMKSLLVGHHHSVWKVSSDSTSRGTRPLGYVSKCLYSTTSSLSESSDSSKSKKNQFISTRGASAVGLLPTYLADARAVVSYSKETPNGALQLGVAESLLLEDWLLPMFNQHPDISADCIYYQPTMGRLAARQAFASYMQELLKLSYTPDPDKIILGAGCNAVLENLCMVLADAGDAILIPTPYYAAFEFDVAARAGLVVEPVITTATVQRNEHVKRVSDATPSSHTILDPSMYYPSVSALEAAYQKSVDSGRDPRILLLSHPHNPLGICYPPAVMEECIDWAVAKEIHVISDEIYAGSIYQGDDDNAPFRSALDLYSDGHGNVGPFVHWVYSLSKDFCASGLRVGASYTCNEDIRLPLQKLNDLCQLPSTTQEWTKLMLNSRSTENDDETWTSAFRRENHSRLRARCHALMQVLRDIGIPYLEATAGLFLWIDLSQFLPPRSNGSPAERERALYMELVQKHGLLFTPGWSMRNSEPGFFRCVFTAATDEEFDLALERLQKFAASKRS